MIASRPEADAKYSRGRSALRRARGRLNGHSERAWSVSPRAVQAVALIGAAALAVAEFEPLYRVRTDVGHHIVRSVSAGSHHSYALLPVAVLGLAALGIALLGDLPDVHRAGLLGTPATGLHDADTVAGAALYLETLGAIALLAAGAAGLVFGPALQARSPSQSNAASSAKSGS